MKTGLVFPLLLLCGVGCYREAHICRIVFVWVGDCDTEL